MVNGKLLLEGIRDAFAPMGSCENCKEAILRCQWCGTFIGKRFYKIVCLGWDSKGHPQGYRFIHAHFCSHECAEHFLAAQSLTDTVSK